jgi:hypothetical protein
MKANSACEAHQKLMSMSGRPELKYQKLIPAGDYQKLIFVPPEGAHESGGGKLFDRRRAMRRAGRGGTG